MRNIALLTITAISGLHAAEVVPPLPRVGVDMVGMMRGMILQLAPIIAAVLTGYFGLWVAKRSLRQTQYYFLLESDSERKARSYFERDWERAAKEERRREQRKNKRLEKDWRRALWENERRERKNTIS